MHTYRVRTAANKLHGQIRSISPMPNECAIHSDARTHTLTCPLIFVFQLRRNRRIHEHTNTGDGSHIALRVVCATPSTKPMATVSLVRPQRSNSCTRSTQAQTHTHTDAFATHFFPRTKRIQIEFFFSFRIVFE